MKKSTARIGEAIYHILKPFNNVYAIVADEGTTFPFIVYRRASGYSQSSKDGIFSATATIEVKIATVDYPEGVKIADEVIHTMEAVRGDVKGFDIWQIRMIDSDENYIESTFIQTLKFSVEFSVGN